VAEALQRTYILWCDWHFTIQKLAVDESTSWENVIMSCILLLFCCKPNDGVKRLYQKYQNLCLCGAAWIWKVLNRKKWIYVIGPIFQGKYPGG